MRRRNSLIQRKKGAGEKKASRNHRYSPLLGSDPRITAAPRHVEVVHKGERVYIVKIYPGLETPGAELMTVSCVVREGKAEFEMRFDERFAMSFRFKTQSDAERVAFARDQIERVGGTERLNQFFSDVFPEIGQSST
jgi:hypothetical protein